MNAMGTVGVAREGIDITIADHEAVDVGQNHFPTRSRTRTCDSGTGSPALFELDDRLIGRLEQGERGPHHCGLALTVTGRSQRPPHRMRGDECASNTHQSRNVAEALDVDADRRNAGCLDRSLDVSDRHMAHRSNGHEQHGVDVLVDHLPCPRRADVLADPPLGGRTHEGIRRRGDLADQAILGECAKMAEREGDLVVGAH